MKTHDNMSRAAAAQRSAADVVDRATRWLDGAPDHRDSCLSPEEQATHVAVCCARSHGPTLTLDL